LVIYRKIRECVLKTINAVLYRILPFAILLLFSVYKIILSKKNVLFEIKNFETSL
jgi:hypothetical protein